MNDRSILQVTTRPPRIAAIIPTYITDDALRELIDFLGQAWGGRYSALIPFDSSTDGVERCFTWLARYSPDIILCFSPELYEDFIKFHDEFITTPFQIETLRHPIKDHLAMNYSSLIHWSPIFWKYVREINSQPDTKTKFHFISTESNVKHRIFYDLSFGVHSKEEGESLAKMLQAKSTHIEVGDLANYAALHDNEQNPFQYLDISGLQLNTTNHSGVAPTVFVLSRSCIDYAWFWNNRSNFSEGSNNCIAIPLDSLHDEPTIKAIASWITGYHGGKSTYCEIKSISAPKETLDLLARKLRPRIKKHDFNHVDVHIEDANKIPTVTIENKRYDIQALWLDQNSLQFTPPRPFFHEEIKSNSSTKWVIEISGGYHLKGHTPPAVCYETNTRLLNTPSTASSNFMPLGYLKRYSRGNICIHSTLTAISHTITLPTAEEFLSPYLNKLGVMEQTDEKRKCYKAVFKLFGGLSHFVESCKGERYKIISSLWSDKELPCEKNEISQSKGCYMKQADSPPPTPLDKIKRDSGTGKNFDKPFSTTSNISLLNDNLMLEVFNKRRAIEKAFYRRDSPKSYISWLVEEQIVRRVFSYPQCSSCNNKLEWKTKIDLDRPLECSRCGATIPYPEKSFELGYQINPLIYRAVKEGIRPVALTLSVLKKSATNGFMYIPGFKGTNNKKGFDIDIIAICDGELVFCECKNMEKVPSTSAAWGKIKQQFNELIRHGELYSASSVVLASLADEYPADICELAKKKSTQTLRVVLLTKPELEQGYVQSSKPNRDNYPAQFAEAFLPQNPIEKKKKRKGQRIVRYGAWSIQSN